MKGKMRVGQTLGAAAAPRGGRVVGLAFGSGVLVPALLSLLAACGQSAKEPSAPAAVEPFSLFGMKKLPHCETTGVPQYSGVFRLRIPPKAFDELANNATIPTHATFATSDSGPEANETSTNTYNEGGNTYSIADNPYHTDLTNKPLTPGQYLKYKVILLAGTGLTFMGPGSYDPDVRGIIAQGSLVDAQTFYCVEAPSTQSNGDEVAVFYVKYVSALPPKLTPDSFNIVLIPAGSHHATDTPIVLDPKILNNG